MIKNKILLISQNFYPETISTGIHMTELALGYASDNNDVNVFAGEGVYNKNFSENIKFQNINKKISITRVKSLGKKHGGIFQRLLFALSFTFKAMQYVKKHHKSFTHIVFPTNPPLLYLFLLLSRNRQTHYTLILYDIYPDIVGKLGKLSKKSLTYKFWNILDRRAALKADKIIVIGEDMKNIILSKYGSKLEQRISLIQNWSIDYSLSKTKPIKNILNYNNTEGKPLLLYSGTMGTTHNVEDIIVLAKKMTNFFFLLVGGGAKYEQILKLSQNLSNVQVEPFVDYEDVPSLLKECIASFVCLKNEFTGLSVPSKSYGIWSAGKPIIGLLSKDSEIGITIVKNNAGIVIENIEVGTASSDLEKWLISLDQKDTSLICRNLYENNYSYYLTMSKYRNELI